MKKEMIVGSLAAMLWSAGVAAEGYEPPPSDSSSAAIGERLYVSPTFTYTLADGGRRTDDGYGVSLGFGKRISEVLLTELSAQYTQFDNKDRNGAAKLAGLGLNALFFPTKGASYALLGAGYGRVSDHPGNDANYGALLFNLGAGYLWSPFPSTMPGLSVRTEVSWRLDAHNDHRTGEELGNGRKDFNDAVIGVGVLIPLGKASAPVATAPEPAQVVPVAEPEAAPVAAAAAEPSCRTPEAGQQIDFSSCGAGDIIVLKGVMFEFNEDRLTPMARSILDGVADALVAAAAIKVEVGGHTDDKGGDEYNQKLSERRAKSVEKYLVGKGVEASRLSVAGYGESKPLADNTTDEGRELNRRVELKIIGEPDATVAPADSAAATPAESGQ